MLYPPKLPPQLHLNIQITLLLTATQTYKLPKYFELHHESDLTVSLDENFNKCAWTSYFTNKYPQFEGYNYETALGEANWGLGWVAVLSSFGVTAQPSPRKNWGWPCSHSLFSLGPTLGWLRGNPLFSLKGGPFSSPGVVMRHPVFFWDGYNGPKPLGEE